MLYHLHLFVTMFTIGGKIVYSSRAKTDPANTLLSKLSNEFELYLREFNDFSFCKGIKCSYERERSTYTNLTCHGAVTVSSKSNTKGCPQQEDA